MSFLWWVGDLVEISDEGLGLAESFDLNLPRKSLRFRVIKSLVRQLIGELTIAKNIPRGALFRIEFPLRSDGLCREAEWARSQSSSERQRRVLASAKEAAPEWNRTGAAWADKSAYCAGAGWRINEPSPAELHRSSEAFLNLRERLIWKVP